MVSKINKQSNAQPIIEEILEYTEKQFKKQIKKNPNIALINITDKVIGGKMYKKIEKNYDDVVIE